MRHAPDASNDRIAGVFSLDGKSIAYIPRQSSDDAEYFSGTMAVHVLNLATGEDRIVVSCPETAHGGAGGLAWQPGPGLIAGLSGAQLDGNLIGLDLQLSFRPRNLYSAGNQGRARHEHVRQEHQGRR